MTDVITPARRILGLYNINYLYYGNERDTHKAHSIAVFSLPMSRQYTEAEGSGHCRQRSLRHYPCRLHRSPGTGNQHHAPFGDYAEAFPAVTPVEAIEDDTTINIPPADIPQRAWSIYLEPYSRHGSEHRNWHRMWINTAVLSGAFLGTLFVLQCLPEDATSWNRAAIQNTEFYTRWYRNIFVKNPEIDHDNPIFNYILHPYAGAAYFMAARSCGFSFGLDALLGAHLDGRVGVRSRSLHGTPLVSGHSHHPCRRQYSRRAFLQMQAPYRRTRLHPHGARGCLAT